MRVLRLSESFLNYTNPHPSPWDFMNPFWLYQICQVKLQERQTYIIGTFLDSFSLI